MINLIDTDYSILKSSENPQKLGLNLTVGESPNSEITFLDLVKNQFSKVNEMQFKANEKIKEMVVNEPGSDVHDVMYHVTKAQLSLYITKAVVERTLRAYNDIMNIR